jgi:GNAT superfamily N-acetyltransferase
MRVQSLPLSSRPAALDPLAALPAEWDAWAEEPAHQVLIEEHGAAVGAVHVAVVSAVEAWLEGLRVRAGRQGAGVGRRLVAEGEALARRYGATVARTAIPAHEYAAQAVAERAGYRPVTRAIVVEAPVVAGPIDVPYDALVREAEDADVAAVASWLPAGETVPAWQGLVPLGWRFRAVVPALVRGLVKDRRVLRAGEALEGIACFAVRGDAVVVSVLDGIPAVLPALVGAAAVRGRERGATRVVLFAPDDRLLRGVRLDRRPHPWCPDGIVVVEKALGGSGDAS